MPAGDAASFPNRESPFVVTWVRFVFTNRWEVSVPDNSARARGGQRRGRPPGAAGWLPAAWLPAGWLPARRLAARRLAAWWLPVLVLAVACSGGPPGPAALDQAAHRLARSQLTVLQATWTPYQLPAAVSGAVAVAYRGHLLIAGGSAGRSARSGAVTLLNPVTGQERQAGSRRPSPARAPRSCVAASSCSGAGRAAVPPVSRRWHQVARRRERAAWPACRGPDPA